MEIIGSLSTMIGGAYLLAILYQIFFKVSLQQISKVLNLETHFVSATLSQIPKITIAMFAMLMPNGGNVEIAIGTLVGSVIFNIVVIMGTVAIATGGIRINLFHINRDTSYFLFSIGYLFFVFSDGEIVIIEALIGTLSYLIYLSLLSFWIPLPIVKEDQKFTNEQHSSNYSDNLFRQVENTMVKLFKLITGAPHQNYLWTFFVVIVFTVILNYVIIESTITFSNGLGIPPFLASITLLTYAASVPDWILATDQAKIIKTEQSDSQQAIELATEIASGQFISNIFDILIGIGFLSFISISFLGNEIIVPTEGMWTSGAIMIATTLVVYIFMLTKQILSRGEGYLLIFFYVIIIIYSIASLS